MKAVRCCVFATCASVAPVAKAVEAISSMRVDFDAYATLHNRNYRRGTAEYLERRALFESRRAEVEGQNARRGRLWTAVLNAYTDRTASELKKLRGYKPSHIPGSGTVGPHGGHLTGSVSPASFLDLGLGTERDASLSGTTAPESVSWTNLHVAETIVDQGACGSCWAVTASTVLNAHHEIHMGGVATQFATQEMLSCVPNPRHCGGSGGCDGATVELAMDWVLRNGIKHESEVAYEARDTPCDRQGSFAEQLGSQTGYSIGLTGYETLPSNKEAPLVKAVSELGPVAISVAADSWFAYGYGIFDSCGEAAVVDHAVTLYGYGADGSQKYWLVRNSWGEGWGENGYIRLFRHDNEEDHCGIDDDPKKGIGCDGGPSSVTTCGSCGMLYDSVVPHFGGVASGVQLSSKRSEHSMGVRHVATTRENTSAQQEIRQAYSFVKLDDVHATSRDEDGMADADRMRFSGPEWNPKDPRNSVTLIQEMEGKARYVGGDGTNSTDMMAVEVTAGAEPKLVRREYRQRLNQ